MYDAPQMNPAAMRYARKRYGQAQQLGLVQSGQQMPGDPMAWWRQFSQDPQAWNMGQQLQAHRAQQSVMGMLGGQQQGAQIPGLQGMMGNLMGGGGEADPQAQMRKDLIAQMMAAQSSVPRNPMEGMAEQYKGIANKMIGAQAHPLLKNLFGRNVNKQVGAVPRRVQAVDQATQRARQLAQIMSKRLRGV